MSEKLLFLMNAEQALAFARLVEAAERGDGAAACELGDMYRVGAGGLRLQSEADLSLVLAQCARGRCKRAVQPGCVLRARARLYAVVHQGREVVSAVGGAGPWARRR